MTVTTKEKTDEKTKKEEATKKEGNTNSKDKQDVKKDPHPDGGCCGVCG